MRGYILNVKKRRDEDLIVSLLTSDRLFSLYRFYGARHSPLQLGYKIDFAYEGDPFFMPRLRSVSHLGFDWLFEIKKTRYWQMFAQLLYRHLSGAEEIDEFYFALLERAALKLSVENPKRVLIEAACALWEREGRLHSDLKCLICERRIDDEFIALARCLTPAHSKCLYKEGFEREALIRLFQTNEAILFDDDAIDRLWRIVEEGL
ncbi:MAG: recombination protein RecO [Helicobacteraceae bacterium]|jgi:hypothetical protein|nr:recombination protein RecO [Helicobacteraceae bacterium]